MGVRVRMSGPRLLMTKLVAYFRHVERRIMVS